MSNVTELRPPSVRLASDMSRAEILGRFSWARVRELQRIKQSLEAATSALISTRSRMIDEEHDAYHVIGLIEDVLIDAGDRLTHLMKAIDPEREQSESPAA